MAPGYAVHGTEDAKNQVRRVYGRTLVPVPGIRERMKSLLLCLLALLTAASGSAPASPSDDLELYRHYFLRRFPGVHLAGFADGAYAIDRLNRDNWLAIEEFPPYDPMIDEGETLWSTPFANGRSYADCFTGNPAQRKNYPRWNPERKQVITLSQAINDCRKNNNQPALPYGRDQIASLLAHMAYESRGQITKIEIPDNDRASTHHHGLWLGGNALSALQCV